jgi:ribonuclease P protein component
VERLRSEALPKERRLTKRPQFVGVYETGRKQFSRYAVLFFAGNDQLNSRIGITVTRKVGKANIRNRLKRWTREIYRRQREPLGLDAPALDIVVNIKPGAVAASFEEFSLDLTRALERIVTGASRRPAS